MNQRPPTAERAIEIIVVAYGAPDLLAAALAPLDGFSVTVVDNSSLDAVSSIARDAGARYLDPGANLGFGAGVNHGLAHRRVPRADVLLLNPDAIVEPRVIERLQEALHASAGIATVGPSQVDPDGNRAQVTWPYPRPAQYVADAVKLGRLVSAEPRYVIGSVLLMNADAIDEVGGFDEEFFLYAEEADWEYRAVKAGWRNVVVDDVSATHVGAGTSSDPVRREVFLQAGQERFLRKHFGTWGWQTARTAVVLGAMMRMLYLRGDRRRAARERGALFRAGPVAVEARYRPRT